MKNFSRNAYFKQLKNGRLKFPIKLYLHYCGRRDARKKIIREDASGDYLSPFICREIHLYNLAYQIEKENLISSIMPTEAESEVFQLQIDRREEMVEKKEHTVESTEKVNLDFEQPIAILKAKKLELSFLKNREEEITQLRCNQLYNILQARILTYWEGALQVSDDNLKTSPVVTIDHLMQRSGCIHEKE